ncbi:hypothetical protein ACJ5H2_04935 [Nocardioides sp. R1-1]|uniref:hypothetical protein n=1 Tax=Nocardioides sp. R1-1 TaxID=3383502 RepID=UPI0038CFFBE2
MFIDLVDACRNRLRWNDLSVRRRTAVTWLGYATLGGAACTVVFMGGDRAVDAGPFAGLTLVLAVAAASAHVTLLKLRRRSHCVLYGVGAVGGSVAFVIAAMTARTSSDVASALALIPPLLGSWVAVQWVARLTARGLDGTDLADATTTIRGTAAIWFVVLVLVVAGAPFASEHTPSVVAELTEGVTGLFSVAAIFTYVGPGWTEYQRGLAVSGAA